MDKDKYLSTPDEHFNTNAQYWYFEFTGAKKPETNKPFEVFVQALFDLYFFIIDNTNKPFACIEKIKEISALNDFNETEKLILVDKILGILFHYPHPEKLKKAYIQIVDYRNDLSPYLEDPEIINFKFKFDIDKIKTELLNIEAPEGKYKYLMNLLFDIQAAANDIDEIEMLYYKDSGLLEYLEAEIERAKFSETNQPIQATGTKPEGRLVDDILNNMFTLTSLELENLKNNLTKNDKQYISLNYIGTKKSLWEDLGKLLSTGIDRNEISRVFSEYCYWQKSTAGKSNKLEYDEIYKKIGRKVTK